MVRVPQEGVEPSRRKTTHFECVASTDFAIGAVARLRDVRFRSYRTTHWFSYYPPRLQTKKVRDWRKPIFCLQSFSFKFGESVLQESLSTHISFLYLRFE